MVRRGGLNTLGDINFFVTYKNHLVHPALVQIILYPKEISGTKIFLAYGGVNFSSKMGQLAGDHFITFTSGLENSTKLGSSILWQDLHYIIFENIDWSL